MPETIRAFIFITFPILIVFASFRSSLGVFIGQDRLFRLLVSYLFVIFAAAILPSFWLFIAAVGFYLLVLSPTDPKSRIAYFFMLLLAVPNFWLDIPGLAGIRYIMTLNYPRFLILILLLTLLLDKHEQHEYPLHYIKSDTILLLFILLKAALGFRDNTITHALRETVILFIDVFLPYFVISRYVVSMERFRMVLAIYVFVMTCLALVAVVELVKSWHLYNPFIAKLGTANPYSLYLFRSGMLRASTVFYTPIALGYAICLAYAAYLFLRPEMNGIIARYGIPAILLAGLGASLSRGPWLGFVILLLTYIYLQRNAMQKILKGMFAIIVVLPLISITPYWDKFISLLPFVGSVETENITYRQRLIDNALLVFQKYPLFGSPNYLNEPEMQRMIQGQGIIDVVNSYIGIALENGAAGLMLFILFFFWLILKAYRLTRIFEVSNETYYRLGVCLIPAMVSSLFTISTVSSIDYIPYLYWIFSGLLAAYILAGNANLRSTLYGEQPGHQHS